MTAPVWEPRVQRLITDVEGGSFWVIGDRCPRCFAYFHVYSDRNVPGIKKLHQLIGAHYRRIHNRPRPRRV